MNKIKNWYAIPHQVKRGKLFESEAVAMHPAIAMHHDKNVIEIDESANGSDRRLLKLKL